MEPDDAPVRNIPSAAFAFFATLAGHWLAWTACLWLSYKVLGRGLAPDRVLGGMILPGAMVLLAWRHKGRAPALNAILILAAFAATLAVSVARSPYGPARSASLLVRLMGYAFAGGALHASLVGAVAAATPPEPAVEEEPEEEAEGEEELEPEPERDESLS